METITLSDKDKARCNDIYPSLQQDVADHKKLFQEHRAFFMGLSNQPAWQCLDEGMALLTRIKEAMDAGEMEIKLVKDLDDFTRGPKPQILEGFIRTLQATYDYAHPAQALLGIEYDEICNTAFKKGGVHMNDLVTGPRQLNRYLERVVSGLKNANPAVADEMERTARAQYKLSSR